MMPWSRPTDLELREMKDEELFFLLNLISEEVKRRNNLLGPSTTDIKNQPVEATVVAFIEALGNLGIKTTK